MRTTISVSEPLLANAKRLASERGMTLSEVIEDALRSHLARGGAQASLGEFRLPTVRGTLVNPDIDLDRTSALLTAEDEADYGQR